MHYTGSIFITGQSTTEQAASSVTMHQWYHPLCGEQYSSENILWLMFSFPDLHKLDEWKTLIQNDLTSLEWLESNSSSDASEEDSGSDSDSENDEEQTQMEVD
jgi:hypothetical protein